jgi:hypothetical protein
MRGSTKFSGWFAGFILLGILTLALMFLRPPQIQTEAPRLSPSPTNTSTIRPPPTNVPDDELTEGPTLPPRQISERIDMAPDIVAENKRGYLVQLADGRYVEYVVRIDNLGEGDIIEEIRRRIGLSADEKIIGSFTLFPIFRGPLITTRQNSLPPTPIPITTMPPLGGNYPPPLTPEP